MSSDPRDASAAARLSYAQLLECTSLFHRWVSLSASQEHELASQPYSRSRPQVLRIGYDVQHRCHDGEKYEPGCVAAQWTLTGAEIFTAWFALFVAVFAVVNQKPLRTKDNGTVGPLSTLGCVLLGHVTHLPLLIVTL